MTALKALLWDVDGTLAETEREGHRIAFNLAFEAEGLPWRWDVAHYGRLLRITGGRERLLHDMSTRADAPPALDRAALAVQLHAHKNRFYAELVHAARIPLREGVRELMADCLDRGVRMAVTTTTSRANVVALLAANLGPHWRREFAVLVCGEDVRAKKPDPEVFVRALAELRLGPLDTVAIEDAPGGVAAARAADVPVVVTRSAYFAHAPIDAAIAVGPGLHSRAGWRPALAPVSSSGVQGRVGLDDIDNWRARMDSVCDHPA